MTLFLSPLNSSVIYGQDVLATLPIAKLRKDMRLGIKKSLSYTKQDSTKTNLKRLRKLLNESLKNGISSNEFMVIFLNDLPLTTELLREGQTESVKLL